MYKVDCIYSDNGIDYVVRDNNDRIIGKFDCEKFAQYFADIKNREKNEISNRQGRNNSNKSAQR